MSKTRLELEKEFFEGKHPFLLDEQIYKRMSERQTIFARVMWDKEYKGYRRGISEKAEKRVGKVGFSRFGYALRDAAWYIHDELSKKIRQRYAQMSALVEKEEEEEEKEEKEKRKSHLRN